MINLVRKSSLCVGRISAFNSSRNLVSTPVCHIQTSDKALVRRIIGPTVDGKLLKDSAFVDTEVEPGELDTDAGFLERSYDEHVSEVNDQKRIQRHMAIKKKMHKFPKEPNMLTMNEREHMKFLHQSDPVEWSPERLSESFPALPHVIKRILRNKWKPCSVERIKEIDADVLKNWEKLKRNELKASPKVLEHLKKFINRHENLKAQLQNPKFLPPVDTYQKVSWGSGPLSEMLTKYERDIEKLKSRHFEKLALTEGKGQSEVVVATCERHVSTIDEEIKLEAESREIKYDSFMMGKSQVKEKEVTLEDMKKQIMEKTEKGRKPLSKFEEAVLDKTLKGKKKSDDSVKTNENTKSSLKFIGDSEDSKNRIEEVQKKSDYFVRDTLTEKVSGDERRDELVQKTQPLPDGEVVDPDLRVDDKTHNLKETDVGLFLQRLRGTKHEEQIEPPKEEEKKIPKPPKIPVNYYGTEKDKDMVNKDVELLSGTCFWDSKIKPRNKSLDAASVENFTVNTKISPHLSPTIKTYFTYDYPDKIVIPKDKWIKGKTYKVKDCYYDDDGEFLYRVPGQE